MYCKNCGNEIDPNAAICVKCGFQNGTGTKHCANCGAETLPGAAACTQCGCVIQQQIAVDPNTQKSKMAAGLLAIFLGAFGVHNFYLGYTGKAVAQLLISVLSCFTLSTVSGVWGLVEGIMILCGSTKVDGKGVPLKD